MEIKETIEALSALAQTTRLEIFRLLVKHGENGLPAGDIARTLSVPQNTLSAHLTILRNAGLLRSERQGRSIIYRADFNGTRSLLSFLLEDCCQADPQSSRSTVESVASACCE